MKYPITVTAEGYASRRPRVAAPIAISDAWRFVVRHWGLLAALAITFTVHAPTLRYFFDGDDFVVLGSVEYLGTRQYLADAWTMRDIVPSWRPLTMSIYALEWQLFGMDATAWRVVNLTVHLASIAVLYTLVARVTRRPAVGAIAGLIFGISGAHFDTVTYITALPHVLATFFILGSLLAIVSYAQGGERNPSAFFLSVALFALAFLSNEGAFVFAPVIVAAYALFARRWHHALWRLPVHAAPFVALSASWLAFYQTCTCENLKFDGFGFGDHVVRNAGVYLSWLVLPTREIPLSADAGRWLLAAALLAVCAVGLVRGPNIARVAVLGLFVALLPYIPVEIWTASRYSYAAVAFFATIVAVAGYAIFDRLRSTHHRVRGPATLLALLLVATVAALYGWQTYAQDRRSGVATDRWLLLVNELERNYSDVPDGTTIYIIDGPWTNPMEQYTWVPSVGRALYGDAAAFNLPASAFVSDPPRTEKNLYLRWVPGEGLVPVPEELALAGH